MFLDSTNPEAIARARRELRPWRLPLRNPAVAATRIALEDSAHYSLEAQVDQSWNGRRGDPHAVRKQRRLCRVICPSEISCRRPLRGPLHLKLGTREFAREFPQITDTSYGIQSRLARSSRLGLDRQRK